MPSKKDNLPVSVDVDLENGGTIKYANEVIATIAGVAASEVEGIAGMCTSGGFSDIISGRNRNVTRGVKVEVGTEEASIDLYIVVEYGSPIQKVAQEVQENVRKAVEMMTDLHVVCVDVHVQGVSFEKEKKVSQSALESAHLTEEAPPVPKKVKSSKAKAKAANRPAQQEEPAEEAKEEKVEAPAAEAQEEVQPAAEETPAEDTNETDAQ